MFTDHRRTHLKGQLVGEERPHQVTGVSAQPQQQEPDGEGLVHVPRLTRPVVLSAIGDTSTRK